MWTVIRRTAENADERFACSMPVSDKDGDCLSAVLFHRPRNAVRLWAEPKKASVSS
ncbi:MAG: hypothetical protein J6S41_03915 [Clostridia bacterium]|nr:hypothetical protein [Clostridia bacterium]